MPDLSVMMWPAIRSTRDLSYLDDTSDYDIYPRKHFRAHSVLPDSWKRFGTGRDAVVQRSISEAREIIREPTPEPVDYKKYWDLQDSINWSTRTSSYWRNRYIDTILDTPKTVTTRRIYEVIPPTPTRSWSSNYWNYYPYYSSTYPLYGYGRYYNYTDPIHRRVVREDLPYSYRYYSGITSTPTRDYIKYSYTPYGYNFYYRPAYIHSPRLRDSYLHPWGRTYRWRYY